MVTFIGSLHRPFLAGGDYTSAGFDGFLVDAVNIRYAILLGNLGVANRMSCTLDEWVTALLSRFGLSELVNDAAPHSPFRQD